MVTASHNPPDYIGMKLCREDAIPIGQDSGLAEVRRRVDAPPPERGGGSVEKRELIGDYRRHIGGFLTAGRPIRAAVDCASGAVGPVFNAVFPGAFEKLCFTPDPDFKAHEPDPLKDRNVADLAAAVTRTGAELGIAFDGDGDRCIFLDSRGRRIASDLITILLAQDALKRRPGAAIVYDLRSSRAVPEEVERAGGKPVRERVGHAFIKHTMRKHEASIGGELSGHFYFRDHAYADSGLMACARILSIVGSGPQTLEQRVAPFQRYHATGELNFEVHDKAAAIERLSKVFAAQAQDRLDGISVNAKDWWFNVRPSNTEPHLRLNLEAETEARREEVRARLLDILGKPI
jgi:phosphomannomutase